MKKQLLSCAMALLVSSSLMADSNTKTANTPAPTAINVNPNQVANFSFFDMKGKTHNFSDYKGKWVLVNYWATYCPPCRAEIPDIERFYRANKTKFIVLGMDAGGSEADLIDEFQKEFDITYPLIPAQPSILAAFGEILAIPTSFIISPKGEIFDKHVGIITYDDLDMAVNPEHFKKK